MPLRINEQKRIVIAEDELLIQMGNKQVMESAGFNVCCAATTTVDEADSKPSTLNPI